MGTNYYVKAPQPCDHCGEEHFCKQGIHIGKSSYGWTFTFAWNDGVFYKNYHEMEAWLADKQIFDEYNREVTQKEFFDMVERKMGDKPHSTTNDEWGHIVDGIYFMRGEFS